MAKAWIGLGSNLGDRLWHLRRGLGLVAALFGTKVVAVSSVYDTAPLGTTDQPRFLNAVAALETGLEPRALLRELQRIERVSGRERRERWGPRTLDLDLLVYEGRVESGPEFEVPHPRMLGRAFVLVPLAEIAPDLVVPGQTATARELADRASADAPDLRRVAEPLEVRRIADPPHGTVG